MGKRYTGFHAGPGGNPTGIGDHFRRLAAAGIPIQFKSVDHYGHVYEAVEVVKAAGNLPGFDSLVYRLSAKDGGSFDVPNYWVEPATSAREYWQRCRAVWPPEFDPAYVWWEAFNEIAKEFVFETKQEMIDSGLTSPLREQHQRQDGRWVLDNANWMGHCASELAAITLSNHMRMAAFGWSSGEPEDHHWRTEGMQRFLRLCGMNHERLGVTLHEYSYDVTDIKALYPFRLGRFTRLHSVCDDLGISRPTIFITEWGWELNNVPSPERAMADIEWAIGPDCYQGHWNVRVPGLWYLGEGWHGIADKAQKLIAPVTDAQIAAGWPEETEPPVNGVDYVVIFHLLPQDATKAERSQVAESDEVHEGKSTIGQSAHDAARMVAPGKPGSKVIVYDAWRWTGGDIEQWLKDRGVELVEHRTLEPEPSVDPLEGLELGPLFRLPYVLSSPFDAPRDYGPHEGADYDILTSVQDSAAAVLCPYPAKVAVAGASGGAYGLRVILDCEYKGTPFRMWVAHLDALYVSAGDVVSKGQPLGELGDTGGDWAEHVHITLQEEQSGLDGYVVPKVRDPHPFMNMTPAPSGDALFGLHASTDPAMAQGEEQVFTDARPALIKVMSNLEPSDVSWLAGNFSDAEFVVRAFLSFMEAGRPRTITPAQFFEWTISDVERTLQFIGPGRKVAIELHNEPNLVEEGLTGSWNNGAEFSDWLLEVIRLYRAALTVPLMYPGLSPGGSVAGVRQGHIQFLEQSRPAASACDLMGVHVYWANNYPMATSLAVMDDHIGRFPTLPAYVTEACNNQPASETQKAQEYIGFWKALGQRAQVQGVTYFVASSSRAEWNWDTGTGQTWLGTDIPALVGQR